MQNINQILQKDENEANMYSSVNVEIQIFLWFENFQASLILLILFSFVADSLP